MESRRSSYEAGFDIDDFEYEEVDGRVIDGAECVAFKESHTIDPNYGKETTYYVYITSKEKDYTIDVTDNINVDRFLDSISLD